MGSRGIVILYEDIAERWLPLMRDAGLNALGVHKLSRPGDDSVGRLLAELESGGGRELIDRFERSGIRVAYELHAIEWLLPRSLFNGSPELFRLNDDGVRSADCNLCASNAAALEIVSENARALAARLKQTSDEYFLWPDDCANAVCRCEKCLAMSGADQYMTIVNAVARGLRSYSPNARAAYLAYADAKSIPSVKPVEGVFLEFAPMDRDHHIPMNAPGHERGRRYLELLDGLLTIFRADEAHVLEYWLDNALYSGYRRPPVRVPFDAAVTDADVAEYASRGIRSIKTFGSFIGEEYFNLYGEPPIREYGRILAKYIG